MLVASQIKYSSCLITKTLVIGRTNQLEEKALARLWVSSLLSQSDDKQQGDRSGSQFPPAAAILSMCYITSQIRYYLVVRPTTNFYKDFKHEVSLCFSLQFEHSWTEVRIYIFFYWISKSDVVLRQLWLVSLSKKYTHTISSNKKKQKPLQFQHLHHYVALD